MGNIFNPDFQEFIQALNNNDVDYVLIGGYAVIIHGHSRTTGDLDIWVKRTKKNYKNLVRAFNEFGMSVFNMTEANFMNPEKFDVFSFGVPPVSIDLMTDAKALKFNATFKKAEIREIEGIQIRVIHINDLIHQKKSVNRPKDQDDIFHLKPLDED